MNPETQIERLQRLGLLKEENISELTRPVTTWKRVMAQAKEGDPSPFALLLTHARIPMPLADEVYRLIVAAPWRDRSRGRAYRLLEADKNRIQAIFAMERGSGRPRDVVLDELAHEYGVSRSTIDRAIAENSTPKTRSKKVRRPYL